MNSAQPAGPVVSPASNPTPNPVAVLPPESYHRVIDALQAHLCVLDETGRILEVNRAWRDFTAVNPPGRTNVAVGANYFDVCAAAASDPSVDTFLRGIRAVMSGELREFEHVYPCHSPEQKRWFSARVTRFEEEGRLRVLIIHFDLTRQMQSDQTLRAAEAQFHSVWEHSTEGMRLTDAEGRLLAVNEAYCQLVGLPRAQLEGQLFTVSYLVDQAELSAGILERYRRRFIAREIPVRQERRIVTADGRTIDVEIASSFFDLSDGRPALLGLFRDVTERKRADAVLRESEARFRVVADQAPVLIWMSNTEKECTYFNRYWLEFTGRTLAEEQGAGWIDGVHPDDREKCWDGFSTAFDARQSFRLEYRLRHRDGSFRWLLDHGAPRHAPDGSFLGYIGSCVDFTERRLAEDALQASRIELQAIYDHAPVMMCVVNLRREIQYFNRALAVYVGRPDAEILDDRACGILGCINALEDARGCGFGTRCHLCTIRRALQDTFETGSSHTNLEFSTTLHIDQASRDVTLLCSTAQIRFGDRTMALLCFQDITDRKRADRALQESEARSRQVLETIQEVFWVREADQLHPSYVSPGYERIWGRPVAEACSGNWEESIHPEDRDRVVEASRTRQVSGDYDVTYRILRPDGSVRWIRDRAFPVADARGVAGRIVGVAEDITEHKNLEAQLLHTQRMEALGTLAGGIAHDLNNILAPILLTVGLLREKCTDEEDLTMYTLIQSTAGRGAEIIRQLLTFSRGTEGKRTIVQPRHLLKEMISMMQETFPREIEIHRQLPATLNPILADPSQIHQVLLNLCVNARDAMPNGGHLTLEAADVTLAPDDPDLPAPARAGAYVRITVSDTGAGIPPEITPRIFDPFFTTKPIGKGTGLGLSTALGIVRSHDGFITVDSSPGRGATFRFYLPAAAGEEPAPAPAPSPMRSGQDRLVLVVDDERNVREATRLNLERHHYRVITAVNGSDALRLYHRHRTGIGAVLTDLMMPVMNGLALIQALRKLDPALKIVATTGLGEIAEHRELAKLGVTHVVMKPCDARVLLAALQDEPGRQSPPVP